MKVLVGVSDISFSCLGEGRGGPVLYRKSQKGGGLPGEGRGRGAWKVSAGNLGGGGGLNVFFGAEIPTKKSSDIGNKIVTVHK